MNAAWPKCCVLKGVDPPGHRFIRINILLLFFFRLCSRFWCPNHGGGSNLLKYAVLKGVWLCSFATIRSHLYQSSGCCLIVTQSSNLLKYAVLKAFWLCSFVTIRSHHYQSCKGAVWLSLNRQTCLSTPYLWLFILLICDQSIPPLPKLKGAVWLSLNRQTCLSTLYLRALDSWFPKFVIIRSLHYQSCNGAGWLSINLQTGLSSMYLRVFDYRNLWPFDPIITKLYTIAFHFHYLPYIVFEWTKFQPCFE
jgi:hypothetical protein